MLAPVVGRVYAYPMSENGCRYPNPCMHECCDERYETVKVTRSQPRECPECFRFGGHESYCDKVR